MELPKNITQIGQSDKNCKIYAEDYVISYIKQINQLARSKDMAVALYGRKRVDGEVSYLFLYGACKLDFLQREVRHLSQAQLQEIERMRKKYFSEQDFLGYRLLNGDMVEGFHICEQGICRYIAGYAQFYEKNDAMLAYMLDSREEGAAPELVEQGKYDTVRKRQDERREEYRDSDPIRSLRGRRQESAGGLDRAEKMKRAGGAERALEASEASGTLRRMKLSAAAVFVLICVAGVSMLWDDQNTESLRAALGQAVAELTEQKLPDAKRPGAVTQEDSLVTEDKLTEALQQENAAAEQSLSGDSSSGTSLPGGGGGAAPGEITSQTAAQGPQTVSQAAAQASQAAAQGFQTAQAAAQASQAASQAAAQGSQTAQASQAAQAASQAAAQGSQAAQATSQTPQTAQAAQGSQTAQAASQTTPGTSGTPASLPSEQETVPSSATAAPASASYVIRKGDTLIGISIRQYGSDARVAEICALNQIADPDDIRVGQKILLP